MAGKLDTLLRIAIHPVSYRASLCRTLSRELAVHAARRADGRGRDVDGDFLQGGALTILPCTLSHVASVRPLPQPTVASE